MELEEASWSLCGWRGLAWWTDRVEHDGGGMVDGMVDGMAAAVQSAGQLQDFSLELTSGKYRLGSEEMRQGVSRARFSCRSMSRSWRHQQFEEEHLCTEQWSGGGFSGSRAGWVSEQKPGWVALVGQS